jgi:L-threo-3-deoxy-hexylosonate aldolase
MVILDGYYAGLLQSNPLAIENHFVEVAESSPIPVSVNSHCVSGGDSLLTTRRISMLYNFPAVTSGIDLDHTLVKRVAERAPNTCGIKLTCANVGKLTRLAASVRSEAFDERFPRKIASAPSVMLIPGI